MRKSVIVLMIATALVGGLGSAALAQDKGAKTQAPPEKTQASSDKAAITEGVRAASRDPGFIKALVNGDDKALNEILGKRLPKEGPVTSSGAGTDKIRLCWPRTTLCINIGFTITITTD